MSVSLIGSRTSSSFSVFPPKLDVLKGDVMHFSQELIAPVAQDSYQFEDEASLLGSDYSTEDDESDFGQEMVDSDLDVESPSYEDGSPTAFEEQFEQQREQLSQERIQFDEMARAHSLAKTPNMTNARLNQVTNKLWKKYLSNKN